LYELLSELLLLLGHVGEVNLKEFYASLVQPGGAGVIACSNDDNLSEASLLNAVGADIIDPSSACIHEMDLTWNAVERIMSGSEDRGNPRGGSVSEAVTERHQSSGVKGCEIVAVSVGEMESRC